VPGRERFPPRSSPGRRGKSRRQSEGVPVPCDRPATSWPGSELARPSPRAELHDARAGLRGVLRSPAHALHRVRGRRPALHDRRGERGVSRGDEQRALRRARAPGASAVPDLPRSALRSDGGGDGEPQDLAPSGGAEPNGRSHGRAAVRNARRERTGARSLLEPRQRAGARRRGRGGVHRPPRRGRDGATGRARHRALARGGCAWGPVFRRLRVRAGAGCHRGAARARARVRVVQPRVRRARRPPPARGPVGARSVPRRRRRDDPRAARRGVDDARAIRRQRVPDQPRRAGAGDLLQLRVSTADGHGRQRHRNRGDRQRRDGARARAQRGAACARGGGDGRSTRSPATRSSSVPGCAAR
jgi:hypothetical protein